MKRQLWSWLALAVVLITAEVALAWPNAAGSSVGVHGGGYHGGGYHGGANYSGSHGMPSSGGGYFRGSGVHGSMYGSHGAAGAHVGPGYSSPHAFSQPSAAGAAPYSYGPSYGGSGRYYYQGMRNYTPGWLGWGYGGFGWGFPGWGYGFGFWPYFDYGTAWGLFGGYGGYRGYGSYGFGYPNQEDEDEDGFVPAPSAMPEGQQPEADVPAHEPATPTPDDDFEVQVAAPEMNGYAARGVRAFTAGRYRDAIHDFRHAILDEPSNGRLMLLLSQSLFAVGRYEEAAGAAEMGMRILPQDKWGSIIKDFGKFYANPNVYEQQLKELERARNGRPEAPALRVLLGYHYGFLGFPKHAVQELDKAIQLEPRDPFAADLRNMFGKQVGLAPVPVPNPGRGNQQLIEPHPEEKHLPEVPPIRSPGE